MKCTSTFYIYIPQDLTACPHVVVICHNTHSHPPPAPIATPPSLVTVFSELLHDMRWQLTDVTPRHVMLDSGFIQGLWKELGWDSDQTPSLSDLHPSLANLDHIRHLINTVRLHKFPNGTDYDARIHGWQEFEVKAWDNQHMRSVVSTRAFITLQSADVHFILFCHIFEITEANTGTAITFHHIDGVGFESVVADGHKGQGLGLGMVCVHLCRGNCIPCKYEPHCCLDDLNPYDHFRLYNPMLSLSSFEPHPDLEQTLRIIQAGGKKAKAWLKDKIEGMKFALLALYFPKSLMPADFWKACPTTTNGNEQAHCSINHDSVHLTLLGGVMQGRDYDYDERAASSIDIHQTHGINTHDRGSTHT
ncbi:hypothetical protein PAXRUDRAFT_36216 [Paxillus rubicundulus Ve08.2h10]|uniref:Uncharacterized protein n=1 Tax=Paxillus rubicundulus Ve08.2h10 TaxID=930991 RepID=A0A0D0D9B4_9AGAM|nr:hypothetical protein PAXRUDRAFT_36216 [Paxillus rubicundulus Ve08.2h10]